MGFVKVLAKDFVRGLVYSTGCTTAAIGILFLIDKSLTYIKERNDKMENNQ